MAILDDRSLPSQLVWSEGQQLFIVRSIWRQYGLDMELTATEFFFVGITYISTLLQHTKSIEKYRWGKTVKNDFKN